MSRPKKLRKIFAEADLEIDDLFLLESFQIAYLPGWVPEREFSAVLSARPDIKRFLLKQCPEVSAFIASIEQKNLEDQDEVAIEKCCDSVVWTIADMLVYNKCPELYDQLAFHRWDFREITSISDLTGKTVIDVGSGTGRVALEAAGTAALVYAVEPVARLRQFIRSRAEEKGMKHLYVLDGFLHALPFPDGFADIVITSHALGWKLEEELKEFERVVKKPATIIHCPGTAVGAEEEKHQLLTSPKWAYKTSEYDEPGGRKRKYWKEIPAHF